MVGRLAAALCGCALLSAGCEQARDVVQAGPGAGITAVSMICPQVENHAFPECRAFLSITDQNGQPVTGFQPGNFAVIEGGNPAVVTGANRVNNSADPISVVLCLDRSGSMGGTPTDDLNAAARQFVDSLGAGDSAAIIDFGTDVKLSQSFTTDKALLKRVIDAGEDGGATALFDAVGLGGETLRNRTGRKFLIFMTDGGENASTKYTTTYQAGDAINRGGVCGFAIGLGYADSESLRVIAEYTGGQLYLAPTSAQLAGAFAQILDLMQNLTAVHFRSRSTSEGVREAEVFLTYGSFIKTAKKRYGF